MPKRRALICLLLGISTLFTWFSWKIFSQIRKKELVEVNSQLLPDLTFVKTNNIIIRLHRNNCHKRTIIFYFDSECENCISEMHDFKKHIHEFEDVNILWLSKEELSKIKIFEDQIGLNKKLAHINVAKISTKDIIETFGFTVTPSIFIYGKDGKLERKYFGQTKIETILKSI